LLANCPEGKASLDVVGDYSFATDQTYTLDRQLVRVRTAPFACRELLLDCDEPLVCTDGDQTCTCIERQSLVERGTWSFDGSELLMVNEAGDTTVFGYCRNGESLTLESVSDQYTILYELKQVP
jgi:hypothetical protein